MTRSRIDGIGWGLLVAIAYLVGGKLALLMAIPPGYATAVWPSAGIAVVAVLHRGPRMMPAVALGSFLVNVPLSPSATNALVAASIGVGAALEALLAAYLVKRVTGYPTALLRTGDVVLFLVLTGPVACLLGATWGCSCLMVASLARLDDLAVSWTTWWVGDTIGVIIFAPILLAVIGAPDRVWRRRRRVLVPPLLVGFAVVTVLFVRASDWEVRGQEADVARRTDLFSRAIQRQAERGIDAGVSVASLYRASEEVTQAELATFATRITGRSTGIVAVSWIAVVRDRDRSAYEAARRSVGTSSVGLWELGRAGAPVPAATRDVYFAVHSIAPLEENRGVLGFDLGSEPMRRAALSRACDTGMPVVTPTIRLVQDPDRRLGFLVLVPVYFSGQPADTVAERRSSLRGYSSTVVRVADVVGVALEGLATDALRIRLFDEAGDSAENLLFDNHPDTPPSGRTRIASFQVGGRWWHVETSATSETPGAQREWQAWTVLAGGLFFVGLLGAILLIVTGNETRLAVAESDLRLKLVLGDEIRAITEMDDLLAHVSSYVGVHLDLAQCFFCDVDPAQTGMRVRGDYRRGVAPLAGATERSPVWRAAFAALQERRPVVISDTANDPRTGHLVDAGDVSTRPRALLGVPVLRGDRLVASFWASDDHPRQWELRESVLMQSIGDRTWLWIEHVSTLAQLRELNESLEARIADRTRLLETAVREKDVLLREIHHRVKNNLQVISSLLNLQFMGTGDEAVRGALSDSRNRIQSLALVHDQLYRSADAAMIEFDRYVRELVLSIERTHSATSLKIVVDTDPCAVPLDQAVPCGLIINELITNALKHAFPDGREGSIFVSSRRDSGNRLCLSVRDDGIGLPAGFDPANSEGLGMVIIDTLTKQLCAVLEIGPGPGSSFELRVPVAGVS